MTYYLASIWPLVTLAVMALVLADDLLRSRRTHHVQDGQGRTCLFSLATSRWTRHRFVWMTVLGTQSVVAVLATLINVFNRVGAVDLSILALLAAPFSELAAFVFLISPFLAALCWLRMKFARDARADVLAIALWYSPAAIMSAAMLVGLVLEPEASALAMSMLATSLAIGLAALLVGIRAVRRNPIRPSTGMQTWLMFGLMLQHVVLAWMYFGMPLPHAFVSVLAFGWAHSVWLRESGRDVEDGGVSRRSAILVAPATAGLALLVGVSLWRGVFVVREVAEGFGAVTMLGLSPAMQMVVPSLVGAVALVVAAIAGIGHAFRPFLAALTWSGIWSLWLGANARGWSTDGGAIQTVMWFAGIASTMFVVWAVRDVFGARPDSQSRESQQVGDSGPTAGQSLIGRATRREEVTNCSTSTT